MGLSPDELKSHLKGLLAFTLTPFRSDGSIAGDSLRAHIDLLLERGCSAIFPAGGTGEFFSLTLAEYHEVVRVCVEHVAGRVPVVASAGYGTALARSFAQVAEESGADGVLVLPPYLVDAPQDGLVDHYLGVASATRLGVIVYQRGSTVFEPSTLVRIADASNVVGFKDGVGHTERLLRFRKALGERLAYINGMPTAEIYAQILATCGVGAYSSALLTFMPEVAETFYRAFRVGDVDAMNDVLNRVVLPFAEIRNRVPGYAVSLVKAGARIRGIPVGNARPPLTNPCATDEDDLRALLASQGMSGALYGERSDVA